MATAATQPANPRANKQSSKRVFRSISRFLSGGNKQRPKLPQHQTSDDAVPTTAPGAVEGQGGTGQARRADERSPSRSRSRSTSRSRSPSPARTGGGLGGDAGAPPTLAHSHHRRSGSFSNRSALSGADTDASIYPISPSTRPPSSIISKGTALTAHTEGDDSHSTGTGRSFFSPSAGGGALGSTYAKSYASTKPTTLLSVDVGGGANRIAVVPGTGSHFIQATQPSPLNAGGITASPSGNSLTAPGSAVSSSGPGITFSSLPDSPAASTPPATASSFAPHPSLAQHRFSTSSTSSSLSAPHREDYPDSPSSPSHSLADGAMGIPAYTHAHPRNNPHPAQPPPDNASVLTLASSSFAPSFIGSTATTTREGGRSSWAGGGLGNLKAWSTKRSIAGGVGRGKDAGADEDASVRALAGSRRPSEESLGARSTWSAVVLNKDAPLPSAGLDESGRRKERQPSILSHSIGGGADDAEEEDDGADGKRRRSSMATFLSADGEYQGGGGDDRSSVRRAVGAGTSIVDSPVAEDSVEEGAASSVPTEAKGKGVDPAEHTGASPSSSVEPSSHPLPPPVPASIETGEVPSVGVEPPSGAGTPTMEQTQEAELAAHGDRKEE
ncbi:hypothetical protein JCM10213_004652 [Rhodosporidiobolus nylandii]